MALDEPPPPLPSVSLFLSPFLSLGGSIARRWLNLSLSHAFTTWIEEHKEIRRQRTIMRKIINR